MLQKIFRRDAFLGMIEISELLCHISGDFLKQSAHGKDGSPRLVRASARKFIDDARSARPNGLYKKILLSRTTNARLSLLIFLANSTFFPKAALLFEPFLEAPPFPEAASDQRSASPSALSA